MTIESSNTDQQRQNFHSTSVGDFVYFPKRESEEANNDKPARPARSARVELIYRNGHRVTEDEVALASLGLKDSKELALIGDRAFEPLPDSELEITPENMAEIAELIASTARQAS